MVFFNEHGGETRRRKNARNFFNYYSSDRQLLKNHSAAMDFVNGNDGSKRNMIEVGKRNTDFKTVRLRWLIQIYSVKRFIFIDQVIWLKV